jgi:hypothetical protein
MAGSAPAYGARGFARFYDRFMNHGLEAFRRYYGIYRAQVVDNADDLNQGRIKVRVPSIGDPVGTKRIAYPKTPSAGNGWGFKSTPPKDSFVWVVFEGGLPDLPVWEAGVWGRDHIPEALRDVDQHGWFTPKGHKILLDEKNGQETIQIEHKGGAKVRIDKDGNIEITNVDGGTVYVGNGANEAAVLGDTLKGLLDELVDAVLLLTVPTGTGPSGTPINAAQFQGIKARWRNFLSGTVKVK